MTRSSSGGILLGALLLAVAGCGAPGALPKGPFVAVWNGVESAPLTAEELALLEQSGVSEVFFDAAELSWEGGDPGLVGRLAPALPRALPATLVVSGAWRRPQASAGSIARHWSERLAELELGAERRRATPIGVHFDLEIEDGSAELAAALIRLRRELRGRLFVSLAIEPELAGSEAGRELAGAVDLVVVPHYGQAPGETEDPARWDLERGRAALERLAAAATPFAVAGWTLGEATLRGRGGEILGRSTDLPLARLLRDERFSLRPGSVFESFGRQAVECVAGEPVAIAGWRLARGDSIRVVRPTTADLERLLAESSRAGALGTILRRLPARGESLGMAVSNLAGALAPGAAGPDLRVLVEKMPSARGRRRLRVVLENQSDEPTDYGVLETNYVELRLARGRLGAIDDGEFSRHERLWRGREKRSLRALRQADTLRLSVRFVGGRERFASGAVELLGTRSGDRVTMTGRFLVPGGREIELPPAQFIIE